MEVNWYSRKDRLLSANTVITPPWFNGPALKIEGDEIYNDKESFQTNVINMTALEHRLSGLPFPWLGRSYNGMPFKFEASLPTELANIDHTQLTEDITNHDFFDCVRMHMHEAGDITGYKLNHTYSNTAILERASFKFN